MCVLYIRDIRFCFAVSFEPRGGAGEDLVGAELVLPVRDPEKLRRKAIASVRSRVTNLKPLLPAELLQKGFNTADFFEYLVSFAEKEWGTTREPADREAILQSGFMERNASDDYNAGRRKTFSHKIRKYFPSGIVVLLWNEEDGRFRDFTIEGDFFGELDAAILAERFEGAPCTEESILEALKDIDAGDFIHGVTNEEFTAFIKSERLISGNTAPERR